jgi:HPt (histidine-containing phosphotransfer) domain-containing protein
MSDQPPEILNVDVLAAMEEIQPGLRDELIRVFTDLLKTEFVVLEQSWTSSDWKKVWQIAHSFKSSAANMGAMRFSDCSARLEKLCRHETPTSETVQKLIFELKAERDSLLPLLKI